MLEEQINKEREKKPKQISTKERYQKIQFIMKMLNAKNGIYIKGEYTDIYLGS